MLRKLWQSLLCRVEQFLEAIRRVRPHDERWGRELERVSGMVLARMQQLLGPDIRGIRVDR